MKSLFKHSIPFLLISLLSVQACKDALVDGLSENLSPNTTVFVDTIGVVTTSQLKLYWNGDDPDGEILGFIYSLDSGQTWTFTEENTKTVNVPTRGFDTLLTRVFVSAIDQRGNGKFDQNLILNGFNIGNEPYSDLDSNQVYTSGEPFIDFGAVDPSPAGFYVTVKNTPPEAVIPGSFSVPSNSLAVVTFYLEPKDLDGPNTIASIELSLNSIEEESFKSFPVSYTDGVASTAFPITLKGDLTDTLSTELIVDVLIGTRLTDTGVKLGPLKLDDFNRLYFRVVDESGSRSSISTLPDSANTWKVNKPQSGGEILLLRDHNEADRDNLRQILGLVPTSKGEFYSNLDVFSLQTSTGTPVLSSVVSKTNLACIMEQFDKVIWYGKTNSDLGLASQVIPDYLANGGHLIFKTGFSRTAAGRDLDLSFLPIESIYESFADGSSGIISLWNKDSKMVKDSIQFTFPVAKPDADFFLTLPDNISASKAIFNPGIYTFKPNTNAFVLYRLDFPQSNKGERWPVDKEEFKGMGTPAVMIENVNRNLVFTTMELNIMDGTLAGYPKTEGQLTFNNPLIEFFYRFLSVEFER